MSTKFDWRRPHTLSAESTATLSWRVPEGSLPGTYRFRHRGDYKHIFDGTTPFTGVSGALRKLKSCLDVVKAVAGQDHLQALASSALIACVRLLRVLESFS